MMKRTNSFLFALLFGCLLQVPVSFSEEVPPGIPAPAFTLTDTNGQAHSLSDYKGKFVVLEWYNPDCPFVVKNYESNNMQNLQQEFSGKDVVWLSINSSAAGKQGHYSGKEHNKILTERGGHQSALLLDPTGEVGHLYGAKTTPHMFVINPEGIVVYNGAIDNDAWARGEDIARAKNYVRQALNEAMAGQMVSEPLTQPYGCSVKYA